jgi:hypothetical protein
MTDELDYLPSMVWSFQYSPWPEEVDSIDQMEEEGLSFSDNVVVIPSMWDGEATIYSVLGASIDDEGEHSTMSMDELYKTWVAMAMFLSQRKELSAESRKRCGKVLFEESEIISSIYVDFGGPDDESV